MAHRPQMCSPALHTHTHACIVLSASQFIWAVLFHAKCWPNVSISNMYQINLISVVEKTCCYLLIFLLINPHVAFSFSYWLRLQDWLKLYKVRLLYVQSVIALERSPCASFLWYSLICTLLECLVTLSSGLLLCSYVLSLCGMGSASSLPGRLEKSMEPSTTVLSNYS